MNWIKRLFKKPIPIQPPHKHEWELEYRTGNMHDGKSDVCSCKCGQWSVRHYGQSERILLNTTNTFNQ